MCSKHAGPNFFVKVLLPVVAQFLYVVWNHVYNFSDLIDGDITEIIHASLSPKRKRRAVDYIDKRSWV